MQLDVNDRQVELLTGLLEKAVGDLRSEVRRTRNPELHDRLRDDEESLKQLLERLRAQEARAS